MTTRLAAALLLLLPSAQDEWTPLFNGKDLDGWTPKFAGHPLGENVLDTFRVEGGAIRVSYDKYEKFGNKFGHLFYKEPFSRYRIRIEYRFVGEQSPGGPGWAFRNSGVMLHCQDPATMEKDQPFPVSIEAQFLGGKETGERPTANLCTPGTNVVIDEKLVTTHCLNSKSKTVRGDAWVTFEAEVRGSDTIRHFVDGELVFSYGKPQLDPKDAYGKKLIQDEAKLLIDKGWISLQAESHPIEFRKVEVLKLKD